MARETGRKIIRDAAVRALIEGQTLASNRVFATRVWPLQQGQMPALLVYVYNEHSQSLDLTSSDPHFRTTIELCILARAEAIQTDIELQLDLLIEQVKNALFTNVEFRGLVNWFGDMNCTLTYGDSERLPYAEAAMTIACVVDEFFPPAISQPFSGVDIYVDAANVAVDRTGTYQPPFPYAPTTAPRTVGPDGRVEISTRADL